MTPITRKVRTLTSPPAQHNTSNNSDDDFVVHFSSKIEKIRTTTASAPAPEIVIRSTAATPRFRPVDAAKILSLLSRTPAKHCLLDPVPTWLVEHVAVIHAPVLSLMCNASLRFGQFPDWHKHTVVVPRLKKTLLDSDDLNSYRPISNLSFISKLVDRVALRVDLSIMQNAINCFRSRSLPTDSSTVAYWVCCRQRHERYHRSVDDGTVLSLTSWTISSVYRWRHSRCSRSTRPECGVQYSYCWPRHPAGSA